MDSKVINLLLVEDDPGDSRLIQLALKELAPDLEFTVKTAESLAEGLDCLQTESFNLVLLDLGLPDSQGIESVDRLCTSYPQIPVIVLTGYTDEPTGVEAIRKGASDYLIKGKTDRHLLYRAIRYSLERKQTEESLRLAKKEAEAANEAKSQFLANMSHEIRTPMNAILGFTELLAEDKLTDTQKQYVDIVRESSINLLEIINDILDFSKIEAGKLDIEILQCSLEDLLSSVESLMRPQARRKGLTFRINQCDQIPSMMRTDSCRLRQCLINLTGNAVKFTQQGHVYINVSLQKEDAESFVRFDVEDTGIGIAPDMQEAIFKSFTQADGSSTRTYGGTGLGLTITKMLAGLLHGELSLTSTPDQGSVFSLTVPITVEAESKIAPDNPQTPEQTPEEYPKLDQTPLSGRVLVAEDVATNQYLIKALLERMGLQVTIVDDGHQAVQAAMAQSFDIILMDIQMPNTNGYEAARTLRKQGISIPIIALTAHALKGDKDKCLAAGCTDYIAKPIHRGQLARVIREYLATTPTQRP